MRQVNLKIWHKMIIGISIPSLIALTGSLLTYGYINDVKNRQNYVQIADDLREEVLEIRRNEKNFLLHKNADHYKNFHDAISVFATSLQTISPKTLEEIGKEDFSELGGSMQTYSSLIDNLFQDYRQENDVVEQVREEGRKLEIFVETGRHAMELTTSFILNIRRLEKNYMLFRDADSYNKLNSALSEFKNITPFCFDCARYIEALHNLFSTYRKIDAKVNELQVIGTNLEEITNKIAQNERRRVSSFLTRTQRLLLIALALLCTLGPLFVYKTATYIAAPIKRLAEITRRISEGNLNLRAPLREHDETYSLAQSFNTMLDNLQNAHEALERSLDLLREKQAKLVESEKLASLGTLASGVAHELNNPLNNIYLASQTLSKEIDPATTSEIVKESVKDIFSQTLRVKRIVSDLLEFAREKGPELKKINLVPVITDVLNQLKTSGAMAHIQYDLKTPQNIEVLADKLLLEQVFINLFHNAIDAMEGRGVLNVEIKTPDDSVQIRITDTGKGILPENISRIFDPFFTTKEKGTGLGLAIIYSIIKKHHGTIEVDSEPNKGATFTITLPR